MFRYLDLYICCAFLVFVERMAISRRHGSAVITPMMMLVASFAIVYLLPVTAVAAGYSHQGFLPSQLDTATLAHLVTSMRWFLYSFTVLYIISLPLVERWVASTTSAELPEVSSSTIRRISLVVVAVWLVHLIAGTGISPSTIVDRALHPRNFTDLRVGAGVFVYIRAAAFLVIFVILALAIIRARRSQQKVRGLLVVFGGMIVLDALGGSKTSIVLGPLTLGILWTSTGAASNVTELTQPPAATSIEVSEADADQLQRQRRRPRADHSRRGVPFIRSIVGGVGVLAMVWLAFGVMTSSTLNSSHVSVLDHVIGYQRETYYSARVIEDFPPNIHYLEIGLGDSARAALPRTFVPDKGNVGFYNRYWREVYTPKTVAYQASTFGALAEAHMVFGALGPALYGGLFAGSTLLVYWLLWQRQSLFAKCGAAFFGQWTYFMMRAGILASSLLYVVMVMGFIWLIVRLFGGQGSAARAARESRKVRRVTSSVLLDSPYLSRG